ncbi:hypothetical protein B0H21DRAFT_870965 [Amylocystis lapponica]|nr:hypothetical protein B0H21DRAFT_870965 [Amylocystis lapponica]
MSLADANPLPQAGPSSQSSNAVSAAVAVAPAPKQKEPQTFEFTKRKRWADLLVTELSDAIILVLSATCKVLYCGAAVTELLGWRDEELVDGDLPDLMNVDDRASFRTAFAESVTTGSSLLTYTRLQCKNDFLVTGDYTSRPREVLFELTGHAHVLPDTHEFKCFFAMAKPYPSRNTAMLNTFLELKMENERLQQRVIQLRAQHAALDAASGLPPTAAASAQAAGPSHPRSGHVTIMPPQTQHDVYYAAYDEILPSPATAPGVYGASGDDEGADASGSRKKIKRAHTADQFVCVTCGRTDSPEWRKGPLGPKTLCNACGLRWAKKVRKTGEPDGEGDASGSVVF